MNFHMFCFALELNIYDIVWHTFISGWTIGCVHIHESLQEMFTYSGESLWYLLLGLLCNFQHVYFAELNVERKSNRIFHLRLLEFMIFPILLLPSARLLHFAALIDIKCSKQC